MSHIFGDDSEDIYSLPIQSRPTPGGLATIFQMPLRRNEAKPGRELQVLYDARMPLAPGFDCRYSYLVRFDQPEMVAGNHYHRKKNEFIGLAAGQAKLLLQDPASGTAEELELQQDTLAYIPAGIAHAVVALIAGTAIIMIADHENVKRDEFNHQIG